MKIEVGRTYLTRAGNKAVVLCVDAPNNMPIIVMHHDGDSANHRADGGFYMVASNGLSDWDLVSEYVEPPKPREVWVAPSDATLNWAAYPDEARAYLNPQFAAKLVKFREVIEA